MHSRHPAGVLRNPFSLLGNTVSNTPKQEGYFFSRLFKGGYLALSKSAGLGTERLKFLVYLFHASMIRKTKISVISDDKVFMNDYSHHFTGKNELTGDSGVILRRGRISGWMVVRKDKSCGPMFDC